MLKKELDYFIAHQNELVKQYNGRVLVIKDEHVIGDYENEADAYFEASKSCKPGTFLIQKCEPGKEAYTQTFYSSIVAF